mmetsp:Transcript_45196/g.113126  ORF Transcript_45196/g.113126 Transcript_45196/m.113126 type:complete len:328 (-) Transcript_45196:94-1077(-)
MGYRELVVLDGGMGHELKSRGVHAGMDVSLEALAGCFLPGALACRDRPDAVRALHTEYVEAGARVLTTNNFVATPHYLAKTGRGGEMRELVQAAALRAREAAQASGESVLVAGCLPPLKESYQTQGLDSEADMQSQYAQIAAVLAPLVDILLCETLASRAEVRAAVSAACAHGKPVWVAMTLQDNTQALLRSGEPLVDALHDVVGVPGVEALLLNCCAPQAVTAGLAQLAGARPAGLKVGGYANGFQTTTSEWLSGASQPAFSALSEDYVDGLITPAAYARHASEWVKNGAEILGGCCGIGPKHIRALSDALLSPSPQAVEGDVMEK